MRHGMSDGLQLETGSGSRRHNSSQEVRVIAANVESISTAYYLELGPSGSATEHRELKRSVLAALDQGQQRIVVDCARWSELDLSALSALVSCARVCGQRGVEFDVANLGPQLRATIHALRLGSRLGLVE